ncbi:MAG TPA: crosslink repair DNA glycosylase YcaQ family protein [Opitutaceae bacterium]|nr:crosslink repair DNA glycosylase YcaQ family protein [Opitutaceae bacterium]
MSHALHVSAPDARIIARLLTKIDKPAESIADALTYHGYIQLDPLNVCGRMHDLILRNRVSGYRRGELLRVLHDSHEDGTRPRNRLGFEHYLPGKGILAAWPMSALPYVQAYLRRIHPTTTRRQLSTEEQPLADLILRQIAEEGPATSDQFKHEGRARTAWGTDGRLVKHILEKLFSAGHILITERRDFRRVYDLAERVVSTLPERQLPSDEELQRWLALLRVRQRRLVSLRRSDFELIGDSLQKLDVNGTPVCCLKVDCAVFDGPRPEVDGTLRLLAPLDPLIYDRTLTERIWNFDFTWEVYTPPHLRQRGYYSLPALAGTEIVGDVEPRADWKRGRLVIESKRLKRGYSAAPAISDLASFLGLRARGNRP